jgi:nucleotidyltransferase/DNA polymerase involved in DNA repair
MPHLPKEKVILHIDGDAFFVGVEVAKNPKLKGLPVVTGQEKGIVTALSYEAKALGVVRGMPTARVKKTWPKVIILPGDYYSYVKYSGDMFDIVRRYVDDVEEYSIDECFGDLTGLDRPLKMTYRQIAERIKKEVNHELGLSVSIGVAPTKVLAKIASKWVKPNGLTVIEREKINDFLRETAIEKIWGIGPQTAEKLLKMGIKTALDFVNKDLKWVQNNLSKPYEIIWQELNGKYLIEIDPNPKTVFSSIQKTRTFYPATSERTFLFSQLSKHIEEACAKARHYKLFARKVSFFLKTSNFEYHALSEKLASPTNAPEMIVALAKEKIKEIHRRGTPYRTTGVVLSDLVPAEDIQADLFGRSLRNSKFETIHAEIDALEKKFGKKVVYLASTQKAQKRKTSSTESDDLDRNLLFL